MISVVIPTIPGREHLLEQTVAAYRANTKDEVELIVVTNAPTVGEGWNAGAQKATGDYLHLSADDVLPQKGWDKEPRQMCDHFWPAPILTRPDGSVEAHGSMGGGMLLPKSTGHACVTSPFPFMSRENWQKIGPCLPIHYYADDYLAHRAALIGLRAWAFEDYHLIHLEGKPGRTRVADRAMQDRQTFLNAVAGCE